MKAETYNFLKMFQETHPDLTEKISDWSILDHIKELDEKDALKMQKTIKDIKECDLIIDTLIRNAQTYIDNSRLNEDDSYGLIRRRLYNRVLYDYIDHRDKAHEILYNDISRIMSTFHQ